VTAKPSACTLLLTDSRRCDRWESKRRLGEPREGLLPTD
jgi:hypothetical protein